MIKKQFSNFIAQALLVLLVSLSLYSPALAAESWEENAVIMLDNKLSFINADKLDANNPQDAIIKHVGKHVTLNSTHPHLEFVHLKDDNYTVYIEQKMGTALKPSEFEKNESFRVDTFEFPYGTSKVLILKPGSSALPEEVCHFTVVAHSPGHKIRRALRPLGVPATGVLYGVLSAPNAFAQWIRSSVTVAKQGKWN